jgi:hypothetical protein
MGPPQVIKERSGTPEDEANTGLLREGLRPADVRRGTGLQFRLLALSLS